MWEHGDILNAGSISAWGSEIVFLRIEPDERSSIISTANLISTLPNLYWPLFSTSDGQLIPCTCLTPQAYCLFNTCLDFYRKNIEHVRIIRDSTPNLYMVLLKFKDQVNNCVYLCCLKDVLIVDLSLCRVIISLTTFARNGPYLCKSQKSAFRF